MDEKKPEFLMSGLLVGYEIGQRFGMEMQITLTFAQSEEDLQAERFMETAFSIHPAMALDLARQLERGARSLLPVSAPSGTKFQ